MLFEYPFPPKRYLQLLLILKQKYGSGVTVFASPLHVHRDRTDSIDLVAAANQFVGEQENRKQLFGSFTTNDLLRKVSLVSRSTQTSL